LVIDPVVTPADKITASDGEVGDYFGRDVAGAGDVNGDGHSDVFVGAYYADHQGSDSGSAYVFLGSAAGVDPASEYRLDARDAAPDSLFGWSVSGAGDLDSDGLSDLVVGAYLDGDEGAAYVFYGSSSGDPVGDDLKLTASDGDTDDHFGVAVSGAGDLDGDGVGDILVGAERDDDNGENSGAMYVYYGTSSGLSPESEQKVSASDADAHDHFGQFLTRAEDLNGDGYGDALVGAYADDDHGSYSGSVYVYTGSLAGLDESTEQKLTASDASDHEHFGSAVSGGGDVDADGFDDIVVGAFQDSDVGRYQGSVYVYFGSPSGVDPGREQKLTSSDGEPEDMFGRDVSLVGDLDEDGFDDLLIGAALDDDLGDGSGAGYVFYGSASGVDESTEIKLLAPDGESGDNFGFAVSGGGDFNGDGADDLIVGAFADDDLGDLSGSAYLYYGECLDADVDGFCASTDCDDEDSSVGRATVWYADSDGDGHGDPDDRLTACAAPSGYVADGDDCDDTEPLSYGGAAELCDGVDNDCNGTVDGDDAVDAAIWYADADGDGFGDAAASSTACERPEGASDNNSDCDDNDPNAWPGAPEVEGDGIDQDCDGEDAASPGDTGDGDGDKDGCGGCAARSATTGGTGMFVGLMALVGMRRWVDACVRERTLWRRQAR